MPGVYLSYPFCAQKCSFCNFASDVSSADLESSYLSALTSEIGQHVWVWQPDTVYLGGGTPSRLAGRDLRRILHNVPGRPWREATIEAAPGSLTPENIAAWLESGINRVSLGVQSCVDRELARTGRKHNAAVVEADVAMLRSAGITNFNIDLIAGLPGQTPSSWSASLDAIGNLQPLHVSVYMFEVDGDSRLGFEILQGGSRYSAAAVPDGELMAEFYETAVERLRGMGIGRYEISNFARPGAESLHNLKYWQSDCYIGFGADAHSFNHGVRWGNVESASEYVARWRSGRPVALESTPANPEEERFFLGLRLDRGVDTSPDDRVRHGKSITRLEEAGLLSVDGSLLRLTDRGVLLSNEVFGEFIS
ncbi:MAG: coproporphyrinogen III oxidase family protein [Bryobacteraceae bacterium]|nr:coproporphyrinogen III oxidase family protein [Bryobacteraceae bacterium]